MKEKLRIILAAFIALMLSCPAFAVDTNRYIALILDTSGSMRGTPIQVQREAAKKFCRQVINAQGDNHVAIISLNTTASVRCEFTKDLDELTSRIDGLSAGGDTNIYRALGLAAVLIDDFVPDDATKHIVLCSDGLPENGEQQQRGPYTYSDSPFYQQANAAYNIAHNIKQMEYNIYTLGFFHGLNDEELTFGRRFMRDLASSNSYYEVTDVEHLEFTFGEIADDVINPDRDTNNPIVIVPGVMGSRLFMSSTVFNEEMKAWDPTVLDSNGETNILRSLTEKIIGPRVYSDLASVLLRQGLSSKLGLVLALLAKNQADPERNLLNQRMSNTLYPRPCENQNIAFVDVEEGNSVYQYGQEYGAANAYENLVKRLCAEYASGDKYRPVYFFSYDWRQSNAQSAEKLRTEIQNILDETGAERVDLVCHSMGGLVASKYYQEYGSEQKVNRIITCGTPYEGSPKLLYCVLTRNMLDDAGQNLAMLLGGMTKELKASFLGVGELVPSENYVIHIPMTRKNKLFSDEGKDLSFQEYQEMCREEFADYDSCYRFQNSLNDGGYNLLLKYDKSYFIKGNNQRTIYSVRFDRSSNSIDDLMYDVKGDGTVPYYSSSISEQLNGLDPERVLTYDTDHGGTVSENECIDWIISKLNGQASSIPNSPTRSDGYIVVRIACPVDVTISAPNGEGLRSSLDENFNMTASFGRLDIIGSNEDIKIACINNSPSLSIVLNGTDTGTMDYDIRYFNGDDEIYKEDSFRDIPINASTIIKTDTDDSKTTVLEVDSDGDGQIDSYLVPDNSASVITVTRQPENQTARIGGAAAFVVEASGNALRYQWNVNSHDGRGWTPITGAASARYTISSAVASDNGNEYHCLLTDGEGHTVSTRAVSLYVYDGGNDDNNNTNNNNGNTNTNDDNTNTDDNNSTSDDNNRPDERDAGQSNSGGGGGCNVSGSWSAMMLLAGMIILTKKTVH